MPRESKKTVTKFRLPGENKERGQITIEAKQTPGEVPMVYYEVEIVVSAGSSKGHGGSWNDTYGSREQLAAFLRGMEAIYNMCGIGFLARVEIPG